MIEIYEHQVDYLLKIYPTIINELRESHHINQPTKEEQILRIFVINYLRGIDTITDDFEELFENNEDSNASRRVAFSRLKNRIEKYDNSLIVDTKKDIWVIDRV